MAGTSVLRLHTPAQQGSRQKSQNHSGQQKISYQVVSQRQRIKYIRLHTQVRRHCQADFTNSQGKLPENLAKSRTSGTRNRAQKSASFTRGNVEKFECTCIACTYARSS